MPVKTAEAIEKILTHTGSGIKFDVSDPKLVECIVCQACSDSTCRICCLLLHEGVVVQLPKGVESPTLAGNQQPTLFL